MLLLHHELHIPQQLQYFLFICLCHGIACYLPTFGEVTGDTVAKAYEDGNIAAIEEYVMRAVEATHQLFEKLRQYIK